MSLPWKEDTSKLSKFELIKLNKDGLDILDDLKQYSSQGFNAITPEDLDLLKWAGVYIQKPKADGNFMMRVKIPSGILTSEQARTIASVARDFGHNMLDITIRQAIQFHWLTIENLPEIHERLASVGLTTVEACGDCPRTVVGNPLAGIDPGEVIDATPIVNEVYDYFQNNRDFSNLPRKFKISISGSKFNPGHAEINDIAFTPAIKKLQGEEIIGFHVMVGGGLSAKPYLAQQLDLFVRPDEVLKVTIAVATIFRNYGYREKRNHARLKFLVADWGTERFCQELLKLTGPLLKRGTDMTLGWNGGYVYGVHKQVQHGLNYVGLCVPVGRLNAEKLDEVAHLADKYGDGSIRTCNSQNIVLANVPDSNVSLLLGEKLLEELSPFPAPFIAHSVACTGNEFCNLALVETKQRLRLLAQYLDGHVGINTPIRIHMNGCTNSCGQQQIADIGIRGALIKDGEKVKEAFELSIGGILGPNAAFATRLEGRVTEEYLINAVEHLVVFFKENKNENETFNFFVRRIGTQAFQDRFNEFLAMAH